MSDFEKNIENKLQRHRENNLFVACSGGLDSMTILFILNKLKFNVTALHVNYQLRGQDSEDDAALVKKFCADNNIPYELKTIALADKLENGGNLQSIAREVRYNWFNYYKQQDTNNRIVLGHHLDDQIETFYLNLARSSGVMGLSCMLEEDNGNLRPLLSNTKEQIKEYAAANHVAWREDVSNSENKYRRNKLRNEILPFLRTEIPSLDESIEMMIQAFQNLQKELEQTTNKFQNQIISSNEISDTDLKQLSDLQVVELFRSIGLNYKAIESTRKLTTRGTRVQLEEHPEYKCIVRESQGYFFVKHNLANESTSLQIDRIDELPREFTKDEIYLDEEKIKGKLQLREWQIGDRIFSIGLKGSQLVSDIIKDAKLRVTDKERAMIVHDDSTIHWVANLKVGRKAIASPSSKSILKVSITSLESQE